HDLGKVSTPDGTLLKPGKLTDEERRAIERHAPEGAEILSHLTMYQEASVLVRHHHERWDGKGYPDGLAGLDIPFGARVIAVADSYDAMTSDRPYRPALAHHVAMAELRRNAGLQFDPEIVAAFERAIEGVKRPVGARALQTLTTD
ncbi:MAG: HD domain-containing protein, partial [Thermomicrobiaceae bacterium]|nr:HD domain-containing protein [Thermomicrobiaceae bacterium]